MKKEEYEMLFLGIFFVITSFLVQSELLFLLLFIFGLTLILKNIRSFYEYVLIGKLNYILIEKLNLFGIRSKQQNKDKIYLNKFDNYNVNVFRFIGSILSENKKIYSSLGNHKLPEFEINNIAFKIYEDFKKSKYQSLSFFDISYLEKLINKNIKKSRSFKLIRREIINLLPSTTRNYDTLINRNLFDFYSNAKSLLKIKLYNNCICKTESDKKNYGYVPDKSYRIEEISKLYLYIIDSILSSISIAYLMFLSDNANQMIKNNDEFGKIINDMLNKTSNVNIVYEKGYELFKNLYYSNYMYLNDEDVFNTFINIMNGYNYVNKIDIVDEYIRLKSINTYVTINQLAYKEIYLNDNELKNSLAYIIQKTAFNSTKELFDDLMNMDIYIESYKQNYKRKTLEKEKEQYLKGDFSALKNEENKRFSLDRISSGAEFEQYLVKLFKEMGYEAKLTGKAGDQGCDLILIKNDKKYCVQAKYYKSKLDNTPIQEVVGSLKYYNGDQGIVITNSSFTTGATKLAKTNDVILIDGKKLQKLITYLYSNNDINRDILNETENL